MSVVEYERRRSEHAAALSKQYGTMFRVAKVYRRAIRRTVISPDGTLYRSIQSAVDATGHAHATIYEWARSGRYGWKFGPFETRTA